MKAVTATSTHLRATVWRDAKEYVLVLNNVQEYDKVKKENVNVLKVSPLTSAPLPRGSAKVTGTRIEFCLDPLVFSDATSLVPNRETIRRMMQERAYINRGLRLELHWNQEEPEIFVQEDGIGAYALSMLEPAQTLIKRPVYFENTAENEIRVSLGLAWSSNHSRDSVHAYCNSVYQTNGGTHATGVRMALPMVVRAYIEGANLLTGKDKDLKVDSTDCMEGLVAVVSIRHKAPVFKGQDKGLLASKDAQGAVQRTINSELAKWLEENPKEARIIALRALSAARGRVAAAKARAQVRKQDAGAFGMTASDKLADCESTDASINELFLVEGDSAGGSAKMARDRKIQAIYTLRGKPLNTWEASHTRIMSNNEMSDLACALGTGLFTDDMTDEQVAAAMAKLRYSKIIELADADIDGSHIECLLSAHFYRHMLPVVAAGHVYIGLPPLYRITEKGKYTYLRDDDAMTAFFRKRAKSVVGTDTLLLPVAARSAQIVTIIKQIAENAGVSAEDMSHAFTAVVSYDSERVDWIMAFAERIMELRAVNCEAVEGQEVEGGVMISGLHPSGRYFTTIINETFHQAVCAAWEAVEALIGTALATIVTSAPCVIPSIELSSNDILEIATTIEKSAFKGIVIQRNKGLGEMNALDLGTTTMDISTRRLVRITVADVVATTAFVGNVMSKDTVDARVQLIKDTRIEKELIDA